MPAPYSMDLRIKVIQAYQEDGLTQLEVSEHFRISLSTVRRYLALARHGESLVPKIEGKGRPKKLDEADHEWIRQLVEAEPTLTLKEIGNRFYKKKKMKVAHAILSRACKSLGLCRKKLSRYASEKETPERKKTPKLLERGVRA